MILKLESIHDVKDKVLIFKRFKDGSVWLRKPHQKYHVTNWPNLDNIKEWAKQNDYKIFRDKTKPLTEVEWLDRVCDNFKD